MYMKLSKNVSAKYYQEKKESLQKKQQYESYKNLSDEKKKQNLFEYRKKHYRMKKNVLL